VEPSIRRVTPLGERESREGWTPDDDDGMGEAGSGDVVLSSGFGIYVLTLLSPVCSTGTKPYEGNVYGECAFIGPILFKFNGDAKRGANHRVPVPQGKVQGKVQAPVVKREKLI